MNDAQQPPSRSPVAPGAAPLASLSARFGALLVDWALCLIVAAGISAGYGGSMDGRPWLAPAILVGGYTVFLGIAGRTPGMFLTGIRCVSTAHGGPIGPPRAFLRGLLLAVVVPALIMDGYRRGLHDRAAGSIMISTKR